MFNRISISQPNSSNDTLHALVQYGEDFLLAEEHYLNGNITTVLDSFIQSDDSRKKEYELLKYMIQSGANEQSILLDSLLSLIEIPYPIINEFQRVVFYLPEMKTEKIIEQDLTGNSAIPSNLIYEEKWDTKNLWNNNLEFVDSSFLIKLVSDDKNYIHPICKTTLQKYGGVITSKQGWRDGKRHNGVDMNLDQWDSVSTAFDGKVRFAKEHEGYGKVVIVRHYNGLETLYAHLAKIKVKAGQDIKAGDLIGLAGSTGNSEGSHLHFEIRFRNKVLNPENIIDFNNYCLKNDSVLIKKSGKDYIAVPADFYHLIESGDYPLKIANRYGLTLPEFCSLNNITAYSKLKKGEKVKIK